jgi:hypothetical protein
MADLRRQYYASVVHPLISILLPFLFLYTVIVTMLGRAFTMYDVQVFPPFYFLILLIAGAAETIIGNILYQERVAGFVPRLRELVVVLIVSFGLILLFYGDLTGGDIDLSRFNIWISLILVGTQWFFSYYIHQKLRDREIFLKFFEGKEQRNFQEVYAAHNHEGGEAIKALTSVRKLLFGYIAVAFVFFVVMSWGFQVNFRPIDNVLIFLLFGGFFLIASMLDRYMDMQRVLASGHVVDRTQARKKQSTMILVFAVVAVVAIPVAGSRPLLPQSYLSSVLEWLGQLGTREQTVETRKPPDIGETGPSVEMPDFVGPAQSFLGERGGESQIGPIIGWIILVLLGVGFLVFLIQPLLKMRREGLTIGTAFKKRFASLLQGMRNGWRSFTEALARFLREGRKVRGVFKKIREQAQAVVRAREDAATRRASGTKRDRRVHNRVLRSFMRFTKWAKRHEVTFHASIAPREFSEMVAAKVPERRSDCLEIASLFEEIVYSHHEIEGSLQNRYHEKVAAVVKSR